MHQELWAGADLKLEYAAFHFRQMVQAIQPVQWTAHEVAQASTGAVIGDGWQRSFYAHFDALLSAARAIPEIIQCCFGYDEGAPKALKVWLDRLPAAEVDRRWNFRKQFEPAFKRFRDLPLSKMRHISQHRTGIAPVEVTISGRFGVLYVGGPAKHLPTTEMRTMPDDLQWMARPIPLDTPRWEDFKIDGQPLFQVAQDYLNAASTLVNEARSIASRVHRTDTLTSPPS